MSGEVKNKDVKMAMEERFIAEIKPGRGIVNGKRDRIVDGVRVM